VRDEHRPAHEVKTGRNRKVRVRLCSGREIARTSKVVVRVKIAGRTARMSVRLGHRAKLALEKR
jgi:hypothetical protein